MGKLFYLRSKLKNYKTKSNKMALDSRLGYDSILAKLHRHEHGHDTDMDTRIRKFLKNKDMTRQLNN